MKTIRRTLGLALLATAVLTLSSPAMAKRGRGRGGDDSRVDARTTLTLAGDAPFSAREAKLRVRRRKGLTRQQMKIEIEGAPTGRSLEFLLEDAGGSLSRISALREKRVGTYVWRVRTRKGQSLPFGVADIAELSGRDLEIRTLSGDVVYLGTVPSVPSVPTVAAATAGDGKRAKVRSELAVDAAVAAGVEDAAGPGLEVRIRVEQKRDRDELRVQVENAVDGLSLTALMDDDAGTLAPIGALLPDVGDVGEYVLRFRTDRDALPFGAASVIDLGGRTVEIHTAAGDVLATGTVPTVASAAAAATAGGAEGADDADPETEDENGNDDDGDADEDEDGNDDDGDADEDEDGDDEDGDADEDEDGNDDDGDADEDEDGNDDDGDADEDEDGDDDDGDADEDEDGDEDGNDDDDPDTDEDE